MDFDLEWLKRRVIMQESAFWRSAWWPTTFRGSNFRKTVKRGLLRQF